MRPIASFGLAFVLFGCATTGTPTQTKTESVSSASSDEANALLVRNQSITERAAKLPAEGDVTDANARLAANKAELESLKAQKAPSTVRLAEAKAELDKLEQRIRSLEGKRARQAASYQRTLSSGFSVIGNLDGTEARLVSFIEDANRAVDKTTWFNFDRLNFKTGSADLDMDVSKSQLMNIAEILKAFPAVTLKVGGYTDNVGKKAANQKLATARAKSVTASIIALGVDGKRLEPEGYGDEHPECPANDTDECRAKNRRIALRVITK